MLPVESGLFSLRPLTMRVLPLVLQRLTPATVTCRAFSIPAPSLGFSPSESVLPVSRTPFGSPCPSFCWSVRTCPVTFGFTLQCCRQSGSCCQDVASLLPSTLLSHQMLTCTLKWNEFLPSRRQRRLLPQDPHCFHCHCWQFLQRGAQEKSLPRRLHKSKNAGFGALDITAQLQVLLP